MHKNRQGKNQGHNHSHKACEANTQIPSASIPVAGTEKEGRKVERQPQNIKHKRLTNGQPIIEVFRLPSGQSSMLGAKENTRGC